MTSVARPVRVVVGLLFDEPGRILIALRNPDKLYGGLWEFPGGKVEPGEIADYPFAPYDQTAITMLRNGLV